MFETFYSNKGGVGRTMALANIACLLAEDKRHPQRVLVWDFDLEAPGLHRLFPPSEPRRFGFVDLAHQFASSGKLPDVGEYIYKSEISGLEVLPAGFLGDTYCRKLQEIDWLSFFTSDGIENDVFFRDIMGALREKDYDYVLIDSRTGLNDQAGICTQILPDLLVFLFRLTDQNVDGLEHLVPAIQAKLETRQGGGARILPVASAISSSATSGIHKNRDRVAKLFGEESLDYVRFDPDLCRDEQLFCRHDVSDQMWPRPAIVQDYETVENKIRRENSKDTSTATKKLVELQRRGDEASAESILFSVLRRRPMLGDLWRRFARLLELDPSPTRREKFKREVETILENSPRNSYAIESKANLLLHEAETPSSESLVQAADLLNRAIEYAPDRAGLYRALAKVCACQGDLEAAVSSIRNTLRLVPDNAQDLLTLVGLQIRQGARYYTSAIDTLNLLPPQLGHRKYVPLSYLHAFFGETKKSIDAFESFVPEPEENSQQWHRLFQAHLKILADLKDEGLSIAEQALHSHEHPPDFADRGNWIEFYICAEEFSHAAMLAEKEPEVFDELLALTQYLGMSEGAPTRDKVLQLWRGKSWGFQELLLLRERMKREKKHEYAERLEIIEQLICEQKLERLS